MKRTIPLFFCVAVFGASCGTQAQNLLVNGDFESPQANVYYDGSDPTLADDVPGWLYFLGAVDGSYVWVAPEADPLAGGTDLDMGIGPARGGIETAPGSRPLVVPLLPYTASVTSDNYFGATDAEFWIDWFDVGGNLIGSDGGPLGDPNGPLPFAPYTQLFTVNASAPLLATAAGVRLESGNASYGGLAADHFTFSLVPEPSSIVLAACGVLAIVGASRRRRP